MSSAYVMVDQEAGKFSVWQVNTGSKNSEIVAVNRQNNMVSEFCANSTGGSSSARSLPTSSTTSPQNEGSELSGGAIGGIVAGALGGFATMGIIGFFWYRRRRPGDAAAEVAQEPELQSVDTKVPTYSMVEAAPQELPVDQYDATELDSRAINKNRY
jgi:hypothetical protein